MLDFLKFLRLIPRQNKNKQNLYTLQNYLCVLRVAWKPSADVARTIPEPKTAFDRFRPAAKKGKSHLGSVNERTTSVWYTEAFRITHKKFLEFFLKANMIAIGLKFSVYCVLKYRVWRTEKKSVNEVTNKLPSSQCYAHTVSSNCSMSHRSCRHRHTARPNLLTAL